MPLFDTQENVIGLLEISQLLPENADENLELLGLAKSRLKEKDKAVRIKLEDL